MFFQKAGLIVSTACSPDSPFCLGGEGLGLVVGRGGGDDLVSVLVDSSGLCGRELRLLLGLLLNLGNLLALLRRRRDLHAQNDVTDLRLSQGGHVHTKTRLGNASIGCVFVKWHIKLFCFLGNVACLNSLTCSFCRNLPG